MSEQEAYLQFKHEINGTEKEFTVMRPSNKVRTESDAYYIRALRKALDDGFFLETEIEEVLKKRGIDPAQLERDRTEIQKKIRDMEVRLAKDGGKDLEAGRALALEIQDARGEWERIDAARGEISNMTATSQAENARFTYFIYGCTLLDGKRYWDTYEEFEADESEVVNLASQQLVMMMYQTTQESITQIIGDRIENRFLKYHGFMDDELQLVNKDGKTVDRDGRLINDKGEFINEEGDRIDMYGNILDEEGRLLLGEEIADKKKAEKAAKRAEAKAAKEAEVEEETPEEIIS
jgi:hypothetical protein